MALLNQQTTDYPEFKLLIVGDGGTGKTTFIKKHLTGEFEKKYEPTKKVKAYPLDFYTNVGKIRFKCFDTVGPEILVDRISFAYYLHAQCAIIMFDVTERITHKHVTKWDNELFRFCPYIPIVRCGNKVDDAVNRQVTAREVQSRMLDIHTPYYEISAKANYNLEKPFLYLARRLTGHPNLHFVESPALAPPEVHIDIAAHEKNEAELVMAASQPLPDDGDDEEDTAFD